MPMKSSTEIVQPNPGLVYAVKSLPTVNIQQPHSTPSNSDIDVPLPQATKPPAVSESDSIQNSNYNY